MTKPFPPAGLKYLLVVTWCCNELNVLVYYNTYIGALQHHVTTCLPEQKAMVNVLFDFFLSLFLQVELPGNAQMFKEGPILKKNVMEGPHKKGT